MTAHRIIWKKDTLTLVQPSVWKRSYELRDGEEIVGTMTFPSVFKTTLHAEGEGVCWSIDQKGLFKPVVIVRACDEKKPISTIPLKQSKGTYVLKLPHYKSVRLKVNIWKSEFILTTTMNARLCKLKLKEFPRFGGEITLDPKAETIREYPWLLFLVIFISLTSRRNSS